MKKLIYVKTADVAFNQKDTLQSIMEFNMPGGVFNKVSLIRLKNFETMAPYGKNYVYETMNN